MASCKERKAGPRLIQFCCFYANEFCNNTLVKHASGMHQDTFSKATDEENKKTHPIPSLKNKVCFFDKSRQNCGRCSGHDDGFYVYALLDWEGTKGMYRGVWTDPAS
eukprot:8448456-Ditylum_brightwellii.AAC.1